MVQCKNNLKQLGLGCLAHESALGFLPSGGWGYRWVGDPDRGFGGQQPGSWVYSVLPFIEQKALYQLGSDGQPNTITATQLAGAAQCISTPLPMMNCPTRRPAVCYPTNGWYNDGGSFYNGVWTAHNANGVTMLVRGDYACCVGCEPATASIDWDGPADLPTGISLANGNWAAYACNGVIFVGSQIGLSKVTDGASNTYLLGEKYLTPDNYFNGSDGADNETFYSGCENDDARTTYYVPAVPPRARPCRTDPVGGTMSVLAAPRGRL